MEEELYALLQAGVTFPVAWGALGEGATLPRAVMYRASRVVDVNLSNSQDITTSRVNIDCFGKSYSQALGAARDIEGVLQGYSGGVIKCALLDNTRDSFSDDVGLLHRVMLTFLISYKE